MARVWKCVAKSRAFWAHPFFFEPVTYTDRMWFRRHSCLILSLLSIAACDASFFSGSAHAALGEDQTTITADQKTLSSNAKYTKTSKDSYTIHEISSGAIKVREYVASNGIVFGLGWNGIAQPDLKALLGKYFSEYESVVKSTARVRGRHPRSSFREKT